MGGFGVYFGVPQPCLPPQEPHSRGHLSRPEAQSLSPYTTSASRAKLLAKNRQTFLLQTTRLTRLSRRLCRDVLQPRRAARRPYAPINANAIKAECSIRLPKAAKAPMKIHPLTRLPLAAIVKELDHPEWECWDYSFGGTTQNVSPRPSSRRWGGWGVTGSFLGFPSMTPPPTTIRRALRKALTHLELRRAARRPNLPLKVKPGLPPLRPGGALPPPAAAPHPASTSEPIVLED
uniref:metastasis-associated protein MTA2-like n=1 Tax=Lonchura striata TaxID=40157 RepID=UPI000B4DB21C|nr:metastasis-associated protein MTA2-like [Lonchura striata domestica]